MTTTYLEPTSIKEALQRIDKLLLTVASNADISPISTGELAHALGNIADAAEELVDALRKVIREEKV